MTSNVTSYKDLVVWQKAMQVVTDIYELTRTFPKHEQYGLTSQMQRAAVSIPSNIAEGYRRGTRKDYRSFLLTSLASGAELETQIEIAVRVGYVGHNSTCLERLRATLDEVMRMLQTMTKKLSCPPTTYPLQPTP